MIYVLHYRFSGMRDISVNICVRLILCIQMLLYSITDTVFLELIYMYFCLFIPCFEKFYINVDFFPFDNERNFNKSIYGDINMYLR